MDNSEEEILKNKAGMFELDEPEADELAAEDALSDEELAITADNEDAFEDA